jgi:hypothetical protein
MRHNNAHNTAERHFWARHPKYCDVSCQNLRYLKRRTSTYLTALHSTAFLHMFKDLWQCSSSLKQQNRLPHEQETGPRLLLVTFLAALTTVCQPHLCIILSYLTSGRCPDYWGTQVEKHVLYNSTNGQQDPFSKWGTQLGMKWSCNCTT